MQRRLPERCRPDARHPKNEDSRRDERSQVASHAPRRTLEWKTANDIPSLGDGYLPDGGQPTDTMQCTWSASGPAYSSLCTASSSSTDSHSGQRVLAPTSLTF